MPEGISKGQLPELEEESARRKAARMVSCLNSMRLRCAGLVGEPGKGRDAEKDYLKEMKEEVSAGYKKCRRYE